MGNFFFVVEFLSLFYKRKSIVSYEQWQQQLALEQCAVIEGRERTLPLCCVVCSRLDFYSRETSLFSCGAVNCCIYDKRTRERACIYKIKQKYPLQKKKKKKNPLKKKKKKKKKKS